MKLSNIYILAGALVAASCTGNLEGLDTADVPAPVELTLSSGISVELDTDTRSTLQQDNGWNPSQSVCVYGIEHGASSTPTPSTVSANSITPQTPSPAIYWPAAGTTMDVYGWYPTGAVSGKALNSSQTFTIKADQSGTTNYMASDLMFASATDCARVMNSANNTANVALEFHHKLSRIRVNLIQGSGSPSLAEATVTIGATGAFINSQVTLNTKTGSVATVTTSSLGSVLTLCTAYSTSATSNAYAVIPPQNLGGKRITVKLKAGGVLTASLPSQALSGGSAYVYNITVSLAGLTVTSSIEPWGTESDAGSATVYH